MNLIQQRKEFCTHKLNQVKDYLGQLSSDSDAKVCSVFVAGSYARNEATKYSDLDAFLIARTEEEKKVPRVMKARLVAGLADAQRSLNMPDFTDGGGFLDVHREHDLVWNLGDRKDDYDNTFTARMLLLLESQCVFNDSVYNQVISAILDRYFVDFHKHSDNFKPLFLMNDVLRFWRTMCLNYENKKAWREGNRAKGHLQNLKLKYSRLLTCFSTVAYLVSKGRGQNQDIVFDMLNHTPLQRLKTAAGTMDSCLAEFDTVLKEYYWFLEKLDNDEQTTLNWIRDEANRIEAFSHASVFGQSVYLIVKQVAETAELDRYLVI